MGRLQEGKLDLIYSTELLDIESCVDLGGMWGVNGGYLDEMMRLHECPGLMVDTLPQETEHGFEYERDDFTNWLKEPEGDFQWGRFDAAILFDVLLYQICPMQVLSDVTRRTRKAILISQPCLRTMEVISVCLQFNSNSADYDMTGRDAHVEEHGQPDRWTTATWNWGQSGEWIAAVMRGFGWDWEQFNTDKKDTNETWVRESLLFVPREGL